MHMNFKGGFASHLLQPGSTFYYSTLLLSNKQKRALATLMAFATEIDKCGLCKDNDLYQNKVFWWKNEIKLIFANQSKLPVGKALYQVCNDYNISENFITELFFNLLKKYQQGNFHRFDDIAQNYYPPVAALPFFCHYVLGSNKEGNLRFAHDFGISLSVCHLIVNVLHDLQNGHCFLSIDICQEKEANINDLRNAEMTEEISESLKAHHKYAQNFCRKGFVKLPKEDRVNQLPSLISGNIYFKLLKKLEKNNYRGLFKRADLNPVHKLWLAVQTKMAT